MLMQKVLCVCVHAYKITLESAEFCYRIQINITLCLLSCTVLNLGGVTCVKKAIAAVSPPYYRIDWCC